MLAVPLTGGILMVDAISMTPIDFDPSTPDIDAIPIPITGDPRAVMFLNNTDMFVLAKTAGQAAIIRSTPGGYETQPYQDAITTTKCYSAAVASDGRIWLALDAGLRVFDPTLNTVSTIAYAPGTMGLAVVDGQVWVIRKDRLTLDQFSNAGVVQRTIALPAGNAQLNGLFGHWLAALH